MKTILITLAALLLATGAWAQGESRWNGDDLGVGCQFVENVAEGLRSGDMEKVQASLPDNVDDAVRMGLCYATADAYYDLAAIMKGVECLPDIWGPGMLVRAVIAYHADHKAESVAMTTLEAMVAAVQFVHCTSWEGGLPPDHEEPKVDLEELFGEGGAS